MEYTELLDEAIEQKDSLLRLAYIGAFMISSMSSLEKSKKKPFNPMLGETFELVTNRYMFLSE
jgi:hypothetical protein